MSSPSRWIAGAVLSLTFISIATPAAAQPGDGQSTAIGERYRIEVSGTMWNPNVFGTITSSRPNFVGDAVDFENDLGFARTRFKDLRLVLRPAKQHRFRFQYTPIEYAADTTFHRDVTFSGQVFHLAVPVTSTFGWRVWRIGYEFDALYLPRGFVGILFEGRYTELTASLATPFTETAGVLARAPLPSIGIVGRAYVLPEVAVNFEVSGLRLPNISKRYRGNYYDWDVNGTINFTNNFGAQLGWRRVTTHLEIGDETGNFKFDGLWMGGVVRY